MIAKIIPINARREPVIGILTLASFLTGYLLARQKFPQSKSRNGENPNK